MSNKAIEYLNNILAAHPYPSDVPVGSHPKMPTVFIVGLPRSGTTLLSQVLISYFRFGFVTNLIAKFWDAPEVGIALARSLSPDPGAGGVGYESKLGRTSGFEGHHEFGYFWKRWFKFGQTNFLNADELADVDRKAMARGLRRMEDAWGRPLLFKNAAALPLQTAYLAETFDKSLFIHVQRDKLDVADSLLRARSKVNNNLQEWYSIKPQQFPTLKNKGAAEQVAGQVHFTDCEIKKQLSSIGNDRKLEVSYEDVVQQTREVVTRIERFFHDAQLPIETRDIDFPSFEMRKYDDNFSQYRADMKDIFKELGDG